MKDSNKPVSELYTISRGQIQHILLSIETRLVWLMNIQAFMLGIYAGTSFFLSPTPHFHNKAMMLNSTITYIGVVINLFALVDMIAGVHHMHKLRLNYMRNNNGQDNELEYPKLYGNLPARLAQGLLPIFNTFLFMSLWIFLILYDHQLL